MLIDKGRPVVFVKEQRQYDGMMKFWNSVLRDDY